MKNCLATSARQAGSGGGTAVWLPTQPEELWSSASGAHHCHTSERQEDWQGNCKSGPLPNPNKHTHTCIYACARTHRGIKGSWPLQPMVPILIILCSIPSFELEVLASKNEVKGNIPSEWRLKKCSKFCHSVLYSPYLSQSLQALYVSREDFRIIRNPTKIASLPSCIGAKESFLWFVLLSLDF